MTTQYLAVDISHDEAPGGVPALTAYPDPVKGIPWTIGFGSTGKDITKGTKWTVAQCVARRDADIAKIIEQCSHFPWWEDISDVRQDVFVMMAYQMGFDGLLKFHATLAAAARGAWNTVAADMQLSLWDRQTHNRAERLAEQAKTNRRLPQPYDAPVAVPVQPAPEPKESTMSLVSKAFRFVFDHTFATAARSAATADPNAAQAGVAAIQVTPMPVDGTSNSPAGVANPLVKQLEDDLNNVVATFVKTAIDNLPVVGGIAEVTSIDQSAANAAKALLVLGEQHALTYLSALFSGHHIAVDAVTSVTNSAK